MPSRYVQSRTISSRLIVYATFNGNPQRDLGIFDKCSGLGFDSDDVKYGEYPVGTGVASREDATLRRPFSELSPEEGAWIEANHGAECAVIQSYAGDDGLPLGQPRTYTGRVKGHTPPEADKTASERSEFVVNCIMNVQAA